MKDFLVKGRPTLTVMVQARTADRARALIRQGLAGGADAFGLQLEAMEPEERTPALLRSLLAEADGKPFYITNYRYGKNTGCTEEELAQGLLTAAECGGALLDMPGDLFCPTPGEMTTDAAAIDQQRSLIAALHARGTQVLMSSHIVQYTPLPQVLSAAQEQLARGADIAKIVTAADTPEQLTEAFAITAALRQQLPRPYLFLCGGAQCALHRRIAPLIAEGMYLCVAERDELATPVQPLLCEARQVLQAAGVLGQS